MSIGFLLSASAVLYCTIQLLTCDQYSLGSKIVVTLRSASVIIQIFSPALVVYADRMRNPCLTDNAFSRLASSETSPQSPFTCLSRNSRGSCSAFCKRSEEHTS